ncbi:MAG: choice-of-anchor V domain-containing protein [Bacteroidota bacterium]
MHLKTYVTLSAIFSAVIGFSFVISDNGIAGRNGSPGETTCNTSGCHTGNPLNASGGSIVIDAPGLANGQYFPGATYPINVTVSRSGAAIFGFGFEALRSSGANGGTLAITNATQTQLKNAVILGNSRTNVVHQLNAGVSSTGSKTFSFNWTAPVAGTGAVTFYAAGNATNGNGSTSGDFIYTTSLSLSESATGINETDNNAISLSVFPNPVSDFVNIRYQSLNQRASIIRLISLDGKTVEVYSNDNNTNGLQTLTIPAPEKSGIYFIEVEVAGKTTVEKVVVM